MYSFTSRSFYDSEDREVYRIEALLGYDSECDSTSETVSHSRPETALSASSAPQNNFRPVDVDQDICHSQDGYRILTANARINLDSYPFLHKLYPEGPSYPFEASQLSYPEIRYLHLPSPPVYNTMAGMPPGRGGWNPSFGWDAAGGPPGPAPAYGAAAPPGGMAYGAFGAPVYGPAPPPAAAPPAYPYTAPGYYPPNTYHPGQRHPQPHPLVSFDYPGINMVNSTGGAGCEPGYNYVFHNEHTKFHIFKTSRPPWRCPGMNFSFAKFQVPTNTKIGELMARFGACNPDPMKNKITEVSERGAGNWYRGMIFSGDQVADCQKTIKEVGWDASRNGRDKPVVWLWITKD
ncbi:hypothetical protein F5Y17DRAFT_20543 [Xylariaceae sp. FL0594]|nr:hypothetical protein F5Y17DRAFT_20543 [Xylariaceae sp. FL0594]